MKVAYLFFSFLILWGTVSCGVNEKSDRKVNHSDTLISPEEPRVLPDTLTVAFVGDVMMGTTFPDSVGGSFLPSNNGRNLFDEVSEIISMADFAGCNLEGCFIEGPGERRPMTNPNTYFIFRMPPGYASNLKDAGFDFAGIANNHINDFGEPGRTSTMEALKSAGLSYAGLKDRCEIAYFEKNGIVFAAAQAGHGDNNIDINDEEEVRRVVREMRDSADIVILSFHGGAEGSSFTHVPGKTEYYVGEERGDVKKIARLAVDEGADLVFGHGPHVVRGAELYKDRIIFYSLGNFCTPFRMGIGGLTGQAPVAFVRVGKEGRFIDGKIYSFVQQKGKGPKLDLSHGAAKQIKSLSAADFPESSLKISNEGVLSR